MASTVAKLNEHLALLKKEYTKLQTLHNELERKYNALAAQNGETQETSFVSSLFITVATLYEDETYSDIRIKLSDRDVPAHKFVLNARSEEWSKENLLKVEQLDWSHLSSNIGSALLRWLYTDIIDFRKGDGFALELMQVAHSFRLIPLRVLCERHLIGSVDVRTCVKFYTAADEIDAKELRDHASGVISTYWDDLTGEDFAHLSGPSLYQMLKNKTSQPLHSAIRLCREDVLFLCLVENSANLRELVNAPSCSSSAPAAAAAGAVIPGLRPLELALYSGQEGVAGTLLQHGAEVDAKGEYVVTEAAAGAGTAAAGSAPLLHRALAAGKPKAANFLLQHGADVHLTASPTYDTALHLVAASTDFLRDHYHYDHVSANEEACNGISENEETASEENAAEILQVAKKLLELNADVNSQNKKGFTPLHIAIISDNKPIFDLLVNHQRLDANLKTTTEEHTPLYYALSNFKLNDDSNNYNYYSKKLTSIGARPNPIYRLDDNSLLHILAEEKKEDAAIYLCDHIKNLNHVNSLGDTVLHVASRNGLARLVTELLQRGAMPNMQNNIKKQTALHSAVYANKQDVIDSFIKYKEYTETGSRGGAPNFNNAPDFNVKDSEGETPIALALSEGHLRIVGDLIRGGSDVNVRNSKGFTLLHQAILREDVETAIFLLDQGADMNMLSLDNETPLQLAIHCRLESVVESLCERGVSLAAPDPPTSATGGGQRGSASPLWCALDSDQRNIAAVLVRHGVDTDCWELGPDGCLMTLLHRAIDENKDDIAIFLIQSGCDLDSPVQPAPGQTQPSDAALDKQTPAHMCCQWGLELVLQALIEHGANVNSRDGEMKTPIHVAIENQHEPIISMLLSLPNIDLSLRDKSGLTPFATALTARNHKAALSVVERLPSAAEQTDGRGRNFLHTAILKGDLESVLFLLATKVDVNSRVQDSDQTPPIHLAAQSGDETLLRSLVLAGARVNDRDAHKRTALHVAAEQGKSAGVEALLQNGADCDALDGDGDNALHVAARAGHLQVARVLLTESTLDAEAVNLKGRNPLHELCRCAKENAAAICELFLECMPKYPINTPDIQGNSPLLLAYQKGHRALCTVLVRAGACLGAENKDGVNIFNYQVPTKQLLHRLLDQLGQESPWAESDLCQECGLKFSLTVRKHHCRHCGRILCKSCSMQDVPILKFNLNKPVRVCSVCFDVLQIGSG